MGVISLDIPAWFYPEQSGYEPKTTFWQDFSIADPFGLSAVTDTYRRAFREWKDNYEYLTELCLVLNHKAWQHNGINEGLSALYVHYFEQAYDYGMKHLKGDELDYFLETLD